MREDRLNEIAVVVDLYESGDTLSDHAINVLMNPVTAVQLFREVRRLRDGITGLADEWERAASLFDKRYGKQSRRSIVGSHVKRLRALLADPGDSHTDNTTDRT